MTIRLTDPDRAAALLRNGRLVAFGTETVYGLGGDATNARALAAIFEAKGRPRFNPLICHFATAEAAFAHVAASPVAHELARRFWPGPLTMVLPRLAESPIDLLASAGQPTLAVRVPGHPGARALLMAAGIPVAAPSANRSGSVSPTCAQHVIDDLGGRIAAVLDCGPCEIGLESTVLGLIGAAPVVLRPGGVSAEAIMAVAGELDQTQASTEGGIVRSPGLLASHYAPAASLRLEALAVGPDEALLAFGDALPGAGAVWNLSPGSDLVEAASRLFAGLRWLDAQVAVHALAGIAAMPVPAHGLGAAINDRLRRAAAPRS